MRRSRALGSVVTVAAMLVSLGCDRGVPAEGATKNEAVAITSDITCVRLAIDEGNPEFERITDIRASGIYALRPLPSGSSERIERMTSTFEWQRLCKLVRDSGLFTKRGVTVLARGDHAGVAAIKVTYANGAESTVIHEAYYAYSEPPFWTLIRVIEGSLVDARALPAEAASR